MYYVNSCIFFADFFIKIILTKKISGIGKNKYMDFFQLNTIASLRNSPDIDNELKSVKSLFKLDTNDTSSRYATSSVKV